MRIDVLTIFPEMLRTPLGHSLLGKAQEAGLVEIALTDIRDFATDVHRTVDDAPYGGGPGMVMKCEPVVDAVESLRRRNSLERIVLLTPRGRKFTHADAREWARAEDLVIVCGRYEGIDERVAQELNADEVSIGDYVLSGGEFAALVIVDAVARLVPGVVGDYGSVETDSFYDGVLGVPQYTRPPEFRGRSVPEVLLSGDHKAIDRFRRKEALRATRTRRPELPLPDNKEDNALLRELDNEETP